MLLPRLAKIVLAAILVAACTAALAPGAGRAAAEASATGSSSLTLSGTLSYTDAVGDLEPWAHAKVAAVDGGEEVVATGYTDRAGAFRLVASAAALETVEGIEVATVSRHVRLEACSDGADSSAEAPFVFEAAPEGYSVGSYTTFAESGASLDLVVGNVDAFGEEDAEFLAPWALQRLERAYRKAVIDTVPRGGSLPAGGVIRVRYGCGYGASEDSYASQLPLGAWLETFDKKYGKESWYDDLSWWRSQAAAHADTELAYVVIGGGHAAVPSESTLLHELGHALMSLSGVELPDAGEHTDVVCEPDAVWAEAAADVLAMTLDWGNVGNAGSTSNIDDVFLADGWRTRGRHVSATSPSAKVLEQDRQKGSDLIGDLLVEDVAGSSGSQRVVGVSFWSTREAECDSDEIVVEATTGWVRDMMDGASSSNPVYDADDVPPDVGEDDDGALLYDTATLFSPATVATVLLDSDRAGDVASREGFCEYLEGQLGGDDAKIEAFATLATLNGMRDDC